MPKYHKNKGSQRFSSKKSVFRKPDLSASLDASSHSRDTFFHWRNTHVLASSQQVTSSDRKVVRARAREEYLSSPYGAGFPETFASYVIGTGPQLDFKGFLPYLEKSLSKKIVNYVQGLWRTWADDCRLASTLRLAMRNLVVEGDAFLVESLNPKRKIFGINYVLIDSLRIGNPGGRTSTRQLQDGIAFDEFGNPDHYYIYNVPDFIDSGYDFNKYTIYPERFVHHLFKPVLAGQQNGWSWFAPVLQSMGRLRDYEDGVIEAAKSSANTYGVITTQDGFVASNSEGLELAENYPYYAWQSIEPQRNKVYQLPPGTNFQAFKPEQPTANVGDFVAGQVARMGRAIGLTRNRSTGSSHEYNFASGRLDNQPFEILVKILQKDLFELGSLDRLFSDFYEAILPELFLQFPDADLPSLEDAEWSWRWPDPPLVDPESQYRADALRLQNNLCTVKEILAREYPHENPEDKLEQIVAEKKRLIDAGIIDKKTSEKGAPVEPGTRIPEPQIKGGGDDANVKI